MKEVTDPALLEQLEAGLVTDPALLAQLESQSQAPQDESSPELPPRAEPGSLSYALQGAGAGIETLGRVTAGLVGGGAGALGAGASALPDVVSGRRPLGDITHDIRRGMEEGAKRAQAPLEGASRFLGGRDTIYAPTQMFEEKLGEGMHAALGTVGEVGELGETVRGTAARAVTPEAMHPYVKEQPEAARTAAEYGFEALGYVAPWSAARGAARAAVAERARAVLEGVDRTPEVVLDIREKVRERLAGMKETPRDGEFNIERFREEPPYERMAAETGEMPPSVTEMPVSMPAGKPHIRPTSESFAVARAQRDFEARRQAEGPELPVGPGRAQTGAVGHLDRLTSLERDLVRYQDELRDAMRREEKDTVKYFQQSIDEVKDAIADLKTKYEETAQRPIDPFTGPGSKQRGAVGEPEYVHSAAGKAYLDDSKYFYHAIVNEGDLASILQSGLRPGTNVSGLKGQAFGEGETVLVFRRSDYRVGQKSYQEDGVVQGGSGKPIAILKDTDPFVKKAVNRDAAYAKVEKEWADVEKRMAMYADYLKLEPKEFEALLSQYEITREMRARTPSEKIRRQEQIELVETKFGDIVDRVKDLSAARQLAWEKMDHIESAPAKDITPADILNQYRKYGIPVHQYRQNLAAYETPSALRGPGKRQSGMLDLSALTNWAKTKQTRQTSFEKEQGLPKGFGLALPDLETPLNIRAAETLAVGKDLNAEMGRKSFDHLTGSDPGPLLGKYGLTTEHVTKYVGVDNPLLKAFIDRVVEKVQKVDSLREALLHGDTLETRGYIPGLRYTKRKAGEGFYGPFEKLGWNDKVELVKLNLLSDAAREKLAAKGQQWLTKQDMEELGFKGKVVEAHLHEQKYMDIMYDIVNHARGLAAVPKAPIKKIPGWFPHTRAGHMSITILREVDGKEAIVSFEKANGSKKTLQRHADAAIAEVKEKHPDALLRAEIKRTDNVGGMADLIEQFEAVEGIYSMSDKKFPQVVAASLRKRIAGMEQAFLQESMKRHGTPGWIGEAGVSKQNVKHLLQVRSNYIENALKYLRSQEIQALKDSLSPDMWAAVEKHLPHTKDFIEQFTDVARDRVQPNMLDRVIMDVGEWLTRGHLPYRFTEWSLNKLRGFMSWKDLSWSVGYHVANGIQPEMFGALALVREASRMGKGNPATAMIYAEKNILSPSLDAKARIKWAAEHGVHTAKLMAEIDFMYGKDMKSLRDLSSDIVTGRRASELNEAYGRLKSFLMGVEFYRRAGMTELQARKAAAKFTNDVMVDYSSIGQPLWLSSNPLGIHAGRFVAPYAAFQFSFLGHLALSIQAMRRNPGIARKMLPFMALQMATGTFAGIRGMVGFKELSWIAATFNQWWEDTYKEKGPLMDPMEMLLKSKVNDPAMFGVISGATKAIPGLPHGADLGTTAESPTLGSLVIPRIATGVKDVAVDVLPVIWKTILRQDISDAEKMRAIKALVPSWAGPQFEAAYAPERSVAPDIRNRMRGVVERDEGDWNAKLSTGKPSLKEQRERAAQHQIRSKEQHATERKADITELAADFYQQEGFINPDHMDKAMEEGYRSRAFRRRVKELVEERTQSRLSRMAKGQKRTPTRQRVRSEIEDMLEDYYAQ